MYIMMIRQLLLQGSRGEVGWSARGARSVKLVFVPYFTLLFSKRTSLGWFDLWGSCVQVGGVGNPDAVKMAGGDRTDVFSGLSIFERDDCDVVTVFRRYGDESRAKTTVHSLPQRGRSETTRNRMLKV